MSQEKIMYEQLLSGGFLDELWGNSQSVAGMALWLSYSTGRGKIEKLRSNVPM